MHQQVDVVTSVLPFLVRIVMDAVNGAKSLSVCLAANSLKLRQITACACVAVAMTLSAESVHGQRSGESFDPSLSRRVPMAKDLSALTNTVLYCHDNGLLEDDLGQAMINIFNAGVCDKTVVQLFEKRVSKHKYQQSFFGTNPFKPAKLSHGDYILGLDQNKHELHSHIQYLNAHSLTVAGSGSGKTTRSYYNILQIASHIRGVWLFDLRKREFALLQQPLNKLGVTLNCVAGRSLKINPLQLPKGVAVADWVTRIAATLVDVLELPQRASKLLQTKLIPLYQTFKSKDLYPTLFDLFEAVKNDKGSNHQARQAILDSLEPVLLSLGPKVLAYRRGWCAQDLAQKTLVFELAGLSETDKNLILNTIILSEFTSRIARGVSNARMNLWICLDEAQRLCSTQNQTSAMADLIGLIRGTGIGLDLSLQSAHDVLPAILSNTATKVLGRCGSMADYAAAGRSMGLTPEQIHYAQMNLKPGTFVGQLGEGPWRYPFLFQVPQVRLSRIDHQLNSSELDLPVVYASEFENWGQAVVIHTPQNSLFSSVREYQFCKAVAESPMQPSSSYPKQAGISSKDAKEVRETLIARQFIKEHRLDTGGRGRSSLLLEPLPEGIEAVKAYEGRQL